MITFNFYQWLIRTLFHALNPPISVQQITHCIMHSWHCQEMKIVAFKLDVFMVRMILLHFVYQTFSNSNLKLLYSRYVCCQIKKL